MSARKLTNELTIWSWTLIERPLDVRPLDSFSEFHGTCRFNTEFTTALHLFLSWDRPIQSTSKKFVQVRGSLEVFVTSFFYGEGLLTPRPTPKLEDHPLFTYTRYIFGRPNPNIFTCTKSQVHLVRLSCRTVFSSIDKDTHSMVHLMGR
jgi:hypothetical protein